MKLNSWIRTLLLVAILGLLPGLGIAQRGTSGQTSSDSSNFPFDLEQWKQLSEYSQEAYPRFVANLDSQWLDFPDIHIVGMTPVDTIPNDLALIDINDTGRRLKIRSSNGVLVHWHTPTRWNVRYQLLVHPGKQVLSFYYDQRFTITIQCDIPAGHVLALDHAWVRIYDDHTLSRDSHFGVEDSGIEDRRVITKSANHFIPANDFAPGPNDWPPYTVKHGIPGNALVRFDFSPSAGIENLQRVHEKPTGMQFGEYAASIVEHTDWWFADTAYAYAPYRVWSEVRFLRRALPWENQIRGLKENHQLVLVPYTLPEKYDSLYYTLSGNHSTVLLSSSLENLTFSCNGHSFRKIRSVSDTSSFITTGDGMSSFRLRSVQGEMFWREYGIGSISKAMRVVSARDPVLHDLTPDQVVIGDWIEPDDYSWTGVPLFNPLGADRETHLYSTQPVPSVDVETWGGLLHDLRHQLCPTIGDSVRGKVAVKLIYSYDLAATQDGEPMPITVLDALILNETPPGSGFGHVALRYLEQIQLQFPTTTVQAWKHLPAHLRPESPDTVRYEIQIPL